MNCAVVVTRGDDIGGAQMHVRDVCIGLKRQGHNVQVVVGTLGPFADMMREHGMNVHICRNLRRSLDALNDVRAVVELRRTLGHVRPDLVSLHSSKAGILGRLACRSLQLPAVFTAHGWAFTEGTPLLRRRLYASIEKLMAPLAKRIITVSQYDHRIALKVGIAATRMTQIHNGITPTPLLGSAGDTKSGKARAIMVARFGVPKDQVALLRALKLVPDLELDLVGEGPTLAATRAEAAALGLSGRVRFLGYRNDTAEFLRMADIFCLISNYEGFPYTTLEAMRQGLPTLVSDVGGAGEAVVEGQTGFLIPRGNVDVLAQRLTVLAHNAELRRRMGSAAREHFLANFTFDRMFNRTLAVYEEVLSGCN